ncbi:MULTISPECIES: heparan-alpha-glucosaminide N-acetyltransferase domain-containing protein [unclassified Shewanella]|uniref:DUF1624 domain-containing protein n=1 Tax=unclassified Shewanella TaxID=196818 RepID=UPI000C84242D|nr:MULTISPECIES: heparan-alpha-glucosaminide N-acetyltransferase domain-containing protein [unclassified Shewanella]MDO6618745.1 heparan-alpha-glucosaminide N-acetyltransferase domain-containing protein [Shewanella sp. 6_MG-2023]MDO6678619.1 heparan-alpha-glucosaminide N-acetyltransferase domain-containing protein [Shewanella sp. 4_MG-2023]MDO6775493.1 heparan-alpha-glucosaminide N-acetyltransferase domain-containing protein [Shewanella sp. 3_MG-2023]PMG31868.1 hypothetical protein BCU94_06745 
MLKKRIDSIDIMRGIVMLIMLLDHVRERFFFHEQVTDPMTLDSTSTGLFISRFAAHFCAPTFVFLTGVSAWLYSHPQFGPQRSARSFLIKRGLFIIALECTVITFQWMGNYEMIWLQVMWAIGISMLALALLIGLPRFWLGLIGLVIVFGHNMLTPISFSPGEWGYTLWAILHDRGNILTNDFIGIRASYPVLPWIGVILLGYVIAPIYSASFDDNKRHNLLIGLGLSCFAIFAVLRGFNIYGETLDWQQGETLVMTLKSVFNLTKYPPSLDFLLVTLGGTLLCLRTLEKLNPRYGKVLSTFGSAPMFFYIVHLYLLLFMYRFAVNVIGPNYGDLYGFTDISWVWAVTVILALLLYFPTKWFSQYKHQSKQGWIKYF